MSNKRLNGIAAPKKMGSPLIEQSSVSPSATEKAFAKSLSKAKSFA